MFERTLYNGLILPVAYGAMRVAAPFHQKLRETLDGRRDIKQRWRAASAGLNERPVWFHVASVGEFEQAKPLIAELGRNHPDIPVVVSVTSPSGYHYATRKLSENGDDNLAFVDYLPIDFAGNARFCLAALEPRLLVFVKFDLWPNLIWEAAQAGIPRVLIDATLSPSSKRLSQVARGFYRSVYSALDRIITISDSDAGRFRAAVPDHDGISVAGDTRFDRVMDRKRLAGSIDFAVDTSGRTVIIAGSTWPKDEAHLLGALQTVAQPGRKLLYVIAPHEPLPERVEELMGWARGAGFASATLSDHGAIENDERDVRVIVVDSVGVLAELYKIADIAYVGGSFSTGVHSVIEPAIMGLPVLFGPVHDNSFEALELLRFDAASTVATQADMTAALELLVTDPAAREHRGERAKAYVESQLGATQRCMDIIEPYL